MNKAAFSSYFKTRRRQLSKIKTRNMVLCLIALILSSFLAIPNTGNECLGSLKINRISAPILPSYENHSRIAIATINEFEVWPGRGTRNDPYIIEGLKIVDTYFCLIIAFTSVHFIVRNCYFQSSAATTRTVVFDNVTNGQIMNCTIKSATYGLEIVESANCTISNCTLYDSENGIHVNEAANITLDGNRVYRNTIGIRIDNSTDCTVIRNAIYRNSLWGIFLNLYTDNCTLYNNRLGWNRGASPFSTEQNAYDDGESNLWDDNISQGNYWSDLESDTPYAINGIANAFDTFPSLLVDNENPTLSHPGDISYDFGTRNNTITWICSDEYPCLYQIYNDGSRIRQETWDGHSIVLNLDGLTSGTHNITLRLSDPIHTINDTVIVRVYIEFLSEISPQLLIASSILSVVFVLIVLLILKHVR
jgi:parallel beta-helix repeat protein